jgi:hypothetical protein
MMSGGTPNSGITTGLIEGHAYTVLEVIDGLEGLSGLKLLKMRNPWGFEEFHGDYSDFSW